MFVCLLPALYISFELLVVDFQMIQKYVELTVDASDLAARNVVVHAPLFSADALSELTATLRRAAAAPLSLVSLVAEVASLESAGARLDVCPAATETARATLGPSRARALRSRALACRPRCAVIARGCE